MTDAPRPAFTVEFRLVVTLPSGYVVAKQYATLAALFWRYRLWCETSNRPAGQDKTFARRFEAFLAPRRCRGGAP